MRGCGYQLVLILSVFFNFSLNAEDLVVNKVCTIDYQNQALGVLVLSEPWYHSSRQDAAYIARDNATGIGLEIHWFANQRGQIFLENTAQCDQFRFLQIRSTNRRLLANEQPSQIDVPLNFSAPFYDALPLEFGRGTHHTPRDDSDKPWHGQISRSSTLALYDTPYVGDALGIEGMNIEVQFETCLVCQRQSGFDSLLGCGQWGYVREYIGGTTGWTEPEYTGAQCFNEPSEQFFITLDRQSHYPYRYWLDWR